MVRCNVSMASQRHFLPGNTVCRFAHPTSPLRTVFVRSSSLRVVDLCWVFFERGRLLRQLSAESGLFLHSIFPRQVPTRAHASEPSVSFSPGTSSCHFGSSSETRLPCAFLPLSPPPHSLKGTPYESTTTDQQGAKHTPTGHIPCEQHARTRSGSEWSQDLAARRVWVLQAPVSTNQKGEGWREIETWNAAAIVAAVR